MTGTQEASESNLPLVVGQAASPDDPAGWPIDKVFGRRMRTLRLYHNLTQKQLAERLTQQGYATSQSTVADIETGTRGVRLNQAVEFARFFGVALDDLLYDLPQDTKSQALYSKLVEAQALEQQAHKELDDAQRELDQAKTRHREATIRAATLRETYARTRLQGEGSGTPLREPGRQGSTQTWEEAQAAMQPKKGDHS